MTDQNNFYTTKETAAILGKTVPTIYKYIREGKLTPLPDHKWRMQATRLFPKEQVEELKEKQEKKLGFTTTEAADFLGITRSTLLRFVKEEKIPSMKGTLRGREVSYIAEVDLQQFATENKTYLEQKRIQKRDYYDKKLNIAYYQRYSSESIEDARLVWDENGEWSFLLYPSRQLVSYNEGIYKHDLHPAYQVTYGKNMTTPGFAKITLPYDHPFTMQFMDILYQQCDLSNIYVDVHSASLGKQSAIDIMVKNSIFESVDEGLSRFVELHIVEGSVQIIGDRIKIESNEEILTLHVEKSLKEQLKKAAEDQDTSMQEIANQILIKHFKEMNNVY
ncbi:helix-turn-helix domain-containing protein [Domibacillus epiphyticus]|uniref:Helix-turn-helix domain-containing protein n=1 Tax=Domibacillus epiphyticus TaxID=1714355 RepID=A0A1V2A3P7_9BACI|nr:helix-turn-helix domain-containing protein [Domibacillus epiphyticus]OMP65621.1 hypothetical protein BTO28_16550 [Domibacillus epiphyticus]